MSNSTYCDDHYEQPWEHKEIHNLEKQIKQLTKERDDAGKKMLDKVCEWLDREAHRYVVTRRLNGIRATGLDASITKDLRKAMED